MKINLFSGYSISCSRPQITTWRGVEVPFILSVRWNTPTTSQVIFNIGPQLYEWCKQVHVEKLMQEANKPS